MKLKPPKRKRGGTSTAALVMLVVSFAIVWINEQRATSKPADPVAIVVPGDVLPYVPGPDTTEVTLRPDRTVRRPLPYGEGGAWLVGGDATMATHDQDAARSAAAEHGAVAWSGPNLVWVAGCCTSSTPSADITLHRGPSFTRDDAPASAVDLDASEGRILVVPHGDGEVATEWRVPPGRYRLRIARSDEPVERFAIDLWPRP